MSDTLTCPRHLELMELILAPLLIHVSPQDYGKLLRTCKGLRDCALEYDEWYLSRTRLVSSFRKANVVNEQVTLHWESSGGILSFFRVDAAGLSARAILDLLWQLKLANDHEARVLYAGTRYMLFKTDVWVQRVRDFAASVANPQSPVNRDAWALSEDNGWPLSIMCARHPHSRSPFPQHAYVCDFVRINDLLWSYV